MLLELAERLRCPNAHAPTPLIVVAREKRDREMVSGDVGCPVCHLEARFRDGHLDFGTGAPSDSATAAAPPPVVGSGGASAAPELERVIALLGLADPEGAVLLTGRYAALAAAVRDATGVTVVVMQAAALPSARDAVSAVLGPFDRVPFTDATFRGAAIDPSLPTSLIEDAVRAVAIRGRMLADAGVPVPGGIKELARDDREWVGEREAAAAVVQMGRRGRSEERAEAPNGEGER